MVTKNFEKKVLIAFLLSIVSVAVVLAVCLGQEGGIAVTRNDTASVTTSIYYNGTFNEDAAWRINISVNNTFLTSAAGMNVTEFNVTLPTGFTYVSNTANASSSIAGIINNGNFSNTSTVLKWMNTSTNGAVVAVATVSNLSSYLAFNIIAANPGIFNMTLRWRNGTTAETENITIIVNDTTAPAREWASNAFGNYSNNSKYGIIANLTITDNWATELSRSYGVGVANAMMSNGTVNITLMDVDFTILNSSTATYYLMNTTASIYVNFTNTTGLADGVYYLNVSTLNDTAGNNNFTSLLRKVTLDRTVPTITFSCSPTADVNVGEAVACTCSANDSQTVPIAQSSDVASTTYNTTGYSTQSGTATETCTVLDRAGNTASSVITYTVYSSGPSESSSGGGGSSSTTYTTALFPTTEQLSSGSGYTGQLKAKQKAKLILGSVAHYVAVDAMKKNTISLTVSSTPQTVSLTVGETKKFDVNADGYYDLSVKLNKIRNAKADLTMKVINERVVFENDTNTKFSPETENASQESTTISESSSWSTILWIIILLVIIIGVWILLRKSNKRR